MSEAGKRCDKCGTTFRDAYNLRRHQARKRACDPIIVVPNGEESGKPSCKYCGRQFTTATAMYRHVRSRCKIANTEEGMEKLMEHTLRRQLAEQNTKIDELTALVKQMATGQLELGPAHAGPAPRTPGTRIEGQNQVAGGNINNTTIQMNTIVMKPSVPWDGEKRISVTAQQIAAAFEENARLKEYVRLEEHELTDPEIAPPYVAELLMDLTKRAHADPQARNVYLNPKRADQALVHMTSGKWEVMSLQEATRLIFDGVAKAMVRVTLSNEERRQLPLEAQNALAMAGLLYDDEPEEYAKKAKAPMAAHLSNTAPLTPQICQ